ncbi:MAG: DUF3570 domain-containing protein [Bacteroidota bacterium]|nr:DUF3570 domain-containing protein [Bacteroidota bacterium]
MKKICLTVIGLYLTFLHAFSQTTSDDSTYQAKPLKLEEVNLVSSYYSQNGDHSAITGGIGTEKVTDISNGIELKWVGYDWYKRKHTVSAELGIDHHTAASSAYVSKSGASKTGGTRVYPSLDWTVENEQKGTTFGLGTYLSSEYNYSSFGLDMHGSVKTKNNGEFNGKFSAFFDKVKLIYPSELIPNSSNSSGPTYITTASGSTVGLSSGGGHNIPSAQRFTYTASLAFAQVVNKRMQVSVMTDLVGQSGYLGLPFHRVYFSDGTVHVENLPDIRLKLPIGFRLNYFAGDKVVIRTYYRFYTDDWGLTAHTADVEVPFKVTPFFSISPFYRYYIQTAAKYFAPYAAHTSADQYYTSNYAYSALTSHFFGTGMRLSPPDGIMGTKLSTLELRFGHYIQSTNLVSNVVSVNMQFK